MTFTHTIPVAVKLRHWIKNGSAAAAVECVACGQEVRPGSEHECWTVEPVPATGQKSEKDPS